MEQQRCNAYLAILKNELRLAQGCTEPIAIAYAGAKARAVLGAIPERVTVSCSANIIKNVKSVVVPGTGGMRGLKAAVAVGIAAGDADAELQVLSGVRPEQIAQTEAFLARTPIDVEQSAKPYIFHIRVLVSAAGHQAEVELAGAHTNLIRVRRDDQILLDSPYEEKQGEPDSGLYDLLNVEDIIAFADSVDIDRVREVLQRQIDCNMAIAEEGLRGDWGARIGKILLASYGNGVHNLAKAYAAAGSDARMSGCELPVVINSGSGNQGLTASLPVIIYARELNATQETLYRALLVSNLITIHLKTGIGRLSAYCGATSAGCGAGAGIAYLYGGKYREIAHTIVNAVAINSGMICDGAKASCAAKIVSAVEAGLLGMQMQKAGSQFFGGDGIVVKGVENTIRNVGTLAQDGMSGTDQTIIRLMLEKNRC